MVEDWGGDLEKAAVLTPFRLAARHPSTVCITHDIQMGVIERQPRCDSPYEMRPSSSRSYSSGGKYTCAASTWGGQ